MSGRVLRFGGTAHAEAERLLPWLVNGTLQGDERSQVEQHLADCVQCQRDVALLRSLQWACRDGGVDEVDASQADQSMQRLRRCIDAERHGRSVVPPRRWGVRRAWLHGAIAAQAVLIFALALGWFQASAPATYRTLGAASLPTARLVVVFDPRLSEMQMRRLIRASDARIVDGPTDTGAYVLSVPASRSEAVREALRAASGVTLVEHLDDDRPDIGRLDGEGR
ncbi:zf-HC2 domain-containing protein [Dyella subtropica]|uniref:zf-HC2 domain-containing protein n=1 Tax=Dyella subtropica TaxID=2992127 RepID=UPI00224C854A|nr:zf-HC2 domain-containing protein [Dyella subtropica]